MKASTHKDLIVWQRAMQLVKSVYSEANKFPKEEMYGLISQIRRAAVSIPSNLAEGYAMKSTAHLIKYIYTARGSLAELETQFMISDSLGYISSENAKPILDEINEITRMINKMISSLYQKMEIDKFKRDLPDVDSLTSDL